MESNSKDIYLHMGAGKFQSKHGAGILFEQEVAKKYQLDRMCQRACHCNIDHNQQANCFVDKYIFSTLGIRRPPCRKSIQFNREAHEIKKKKKTIQIVGGDFNAELGPGTGIERISVGPRTLKESNKRETG